MKHLLASAALGALVLASPASADTLREALVSTYRTNPTLNAQRENLRGTDAGVAVARSGGRPQVSATVGLNRDLTRSGILNTGQGKGPTLTGGVDLAVPLFQGGRVRNSVRAAQTRVAAGRATLRAVEGDVFTEAVAAYMDVIRDRAIVELNQNQIRVLTTNLEATRDRFEIGDVTRTDVAQSEARLSLARSALATAQAQLATSEQNYRRVIGRAPDALAPPPPLPPLPATGEEAVRISLVENPDVIATVQQARAAGFDVSVARADRLPTVSGVASGTYVNALGGDNTVGLPRSGTETAIGLNTRIPIFQGGLPAARIRQAQAAEGQLLEQVIGTERAIVALTRSAFASYDAAQRAIRSNQVAVSANELALEGARAERSVGTRTVLEVLNAEQELLNSQVALVSARRDAYVAGFQLLNAMGQAEAEELGLEGGPLYDPTGNYRRVAGSWNDWAGDRRHLPVSTRTPTSAEQPQGWQGRRVSPKLFAMQDRHDPSMEDILASIKKVIAEEKELRAAIPPLAPQPVEVDEEQEEILELDEPLAEEMKLPEVDLGPPLVSQDAAEVSRTRLEELQHVAASAPPQPPANPLESVVREMLRPVLKEWLDQHLPAIVDEHVKREISRITGQGF